MTAKKQKKIKALIKKIKKSKPKVAVLRLGGVIGSAGMMKKGLSLDDLNDDIEKAFEVSGLKAVALQINSRVALLYSQSLFISVLGPYQKKKKSQYIPLLKMLRHQVAIGLLVLVMKFMLLKARLWEA